MGYFEYNKPRILKIYEKEKIVVVLIKSNTELEIVLIIYRLYFESEEEINEIPKSLF